MFLYFLCVICIVYILRLLYLIENYFYDFVAYFKIDIYVSWNLKRKF